jgi:hypothetical protein
MAGMFDGWDTGQGGGTGIFPPWLTQLLSQTPPDVLLQGIQALTQGGQQPPQQAPAPTGDPMVPPNAQFASMAPQGQGYEPRKSIFDRPDSIPGDRMDGAPPAPGMQQFAQMQPQQPPMQAPGASAMAQAPAPQQMAQASPQGGGMPSMFGGGSSGGGGDMMGGLMGLVMGPRTRALMQAQQEKQQEQQQKQQAANITYNTLRKEYGFSHDAAVGAVLNPTILQSELAKRSAKPGRHTIEGVMIDDNGNPIYTAPPKPKDLMKYGPGDGIFDPNTNKVLLQGTPKEVESTEEKAQATARGKATGEAEANLPKAVAKAESALKLIEELRTDEGRWRTTGSINGIMPALPGTVGWDYVKKFDQAKGKAFLEAFEALKGGGQISNMEGEKAQAASSRLDRAMTKEAFDEALDDLKDVITKGLSSAYQGAKKEMPAGQSAAPAPTGITTATGPNGIKLMLKDGKWVPFK